MPSRAAPPTSPVTGRAVAIGLFLAVALNLVMSYNDYYLRNTLLIGTHFPVVGIAALLVLLLAVNPLARRVGYSPFSQGEMLLIWAMIGVGGSVGSTGLMRYIPGWIAAPTYYTTTANDYQTYLLGRLPDWMLLSRRVDDPAVKWFFEGLPADRSIPWTPWIRPLAMWALFGVLLFAAMFAFTAFFYRQWAERERLVFALTYLPIEMTQPAPPGRAVNDFLKNRVMWLGALIPLLVHGLNGLRVYVPGLPAVPLTWSGSGLFPDRPWSEFSLQQITLFFSVTGITFLLTTEVSFSLWFLYVAYRLTYVFVAWLGAGATGFFARWDQQPIFQGSGAVLVIAAFLVWSARASLAAVWRHVRIGGTPPGEPLPSRFFLALLVAGLAGPAAWMVWAGVTGWIAVLAVIHFLACTLVLTRIIAEAGLSFIDTQIVPYDFVAGVVKPEAVLSTASLPVLAVLKGAYMQDVRELLMPYLMHGLKVADTVRQSLRKILVVFAVTVGVAILASAVGHIATAYKYGGVNGDDWGHINSEADYLGSVVGYLKNPPPYDWITLGGARLLPVELAHVATGAVIAGLLLFMRARFLWWPLHPAGFVMCGAYVMELIWFPIFLGWMAKAGVMRFGGATAYRRVLPFFLGLILGEMTIATIWQVVSLVTGRPGLYILPG